MLTKSLTSVAYFGQNYKKCNRLVNPLTQDPSSHEDLKMSLEIGPINHYRPDKETETFISVSAIH